MVNDAPHLRSGNSDKTAHQRVKKSGGRNKQIQSPDESPDPRLRHIDLTAGLLKLEVRPLPQPVSNDALAGLQLSESQIRDVLILLPPIVSKSGDEYILSGFSELTSALIRRLQDDIKIDCVLIPHATDPIDLEPLALLTCHITTQQLVRWLISESVWPAWMGNTKKSSTAVAKVIGVQRETARKLLKSLGAKDEAETKPAP